MPVGGPTSDAVDDDEFDVDGGFAETASTAV
jgi:hypothetical protein